ncbi:MAG: hypothetical protein C5B47_04150 [Verrucomicrobia bacterium]|nr:MAG: hypothetical protein C5B47_04150 [Verrucomicrobiota bacterium]
MPRIIVFITNLLASLDRHSRVRHSRVRRGRFLLKRLLTNSRHVASQLRWILLLLKVLEAKSYSGQRVSFWERFQML